MNRKRMNIKRKPMSDMTTSERKQSFFRWLLRKGVSKSEAALITHKKFYNGDPFDKDEF